jgi:chemotaxis protein CheC
MDHVKVEVIEKTHTWDDLIKKGMTNAVTGLSQMVGRNVDIESINITKIPVKDMADLLGGAENTVIGIYITFSGDSKGHILLAHQPEVAYSILDLLMGDPPGTCKSLDEMTQSALGEMGNITGTFFLNAIADSLGIFLNPSPPIVMQDMTGAVLDIALAEILAERDDMYIAETTFGFEDRSIQGKFIIMPNASFMELPLVHAGGTS